MSAPLFFAAPGSLAAARVGDLVPLAGPEGRHAGDVTRLRAGQEVRLADGTGTVALTEVAAARRGALDLRVVAVQVEPEPAPKFTLVQALAKSDRDLLAIEVATELGVDEVVPWAADRSVVVWRGERAQKSMTKWSRTVVAATKQARRARVPHVADLADRHTVVERIACADLALVLHEEATDPLADVEVPGSGEVLLVVGPEGGISPAETQAFSDAGAHLVRLGPTVLRTSTAGSAALAVLFARTRWS